MGLTMKERKAVTAIMRARYRRATKKQKGRLLDELVALTGYNRWYAVGLLHGHGAPPGGHHERAQARLRRRPRRYDAAVLTALRQVWVIMDCICGKRLVAVLPEMIAVLARHGELQLAPATRQKLSAISAASIDRLLAAERRRLNVRGRSGTKPGTLLKHQIPIRTFAEWDQTQPGFVEIDLVGHDGGLAQGDFCQTLDTTDVASGWTETQAVINKVQVWVFEAPQLIRARLPFVQLRLLNELYAELRLYTNFFQPVMKLLSKERHGAKVKKTYDAARTPYQRLLDSSALSKQAKQQLRAQYAGLNPAGLKRNIVRLQSRLLRIGMRRPQVGTTGSRCQAVS